MKNYYQILGVPKTATAEDIKRAYRKLASQHHPDKGGDKARFQEIQEAYNILGDPEQRQQYDNPMPSGVHVNFAQGGFDFDQVFNMFGANLRGHNPRVPRMTLWVTLKDVIEGGPRTVALQLGDQVSHIQIDIPQGVAENDTIRYPGLAPGGADLIINYRIRPEPGWQREGQDLITEIPVPLYDLILGGQITVRDVRGRELMLTVPAGTQPGTSLRMRAQGIPPSTIPGKSTNRVGDIMVRLSVKIPDRFSDHFLDAVRKERGQ